MLFDKHRQLSMPQPRFTSSLIELVPREQRLAA